MFAIYRYCHSKRTAVSATNRAWRIACMALLLSSCALSVSVAQVLHRGFAWPLKAGNLDPHHLSSDTLIAYSRHHIEPLLNISETKSITPGLVEQWSISADGLFINLQLYDDLYWSDGVEITAQTARDSLLRALSPSFGNDVRQLLYPIKDAEAYAMGTIGRLDSIQVIDDRRFTIALDKPNPLFLKALTLQVAAPLPLHRLNSAGEFEQQPPMPSSGPYILQTLEDDHLYFTVNQDYLHEQPAFKQVSVDMADFQSLIGRYTAGELDVIDWLPTRQLESLRQVMPAHVHVKALPGGIYLLLSDSQKSHLYKKSTRKSLVSVINKQHFAELIAVEPIGTKQHIIPWDNPNYPQIPLAADYKLDLAAAGEAINVEKYRYPDMLNQCIQYLSNNFHDALVNYLSALWQEFDITLEKKVIEASAANDFTTFYRDQCGLSIWAYTSRTLSEEEIISLYLSNDQISAYLNFSDDIMQAYDAMLTITSEEQRLQAVAELEHKIVNSYKIFPLFRLSNNMLLRPTIKLNRNDDYLIYLSQHLAPSESAQ